MSDEKGVAANTATFLVADEAPGAADAAAAAAATVVPPAAIDPAKERALVRRLDTRILPIATIMYLLSFLDRVNIGNARVVNSNSAGVGEMETALGLTGSQYNWALSIFFVGYVIFEVPSNLLLKRLKPSRWLARIMVTWGLVACCLGRCRTGPG
ncbi:hypothetical protein HK405_010441 [Cladochytrium tenue]|nr:hypothetical protein HK405_010441 [Cladochytrium tenue]